MSRNPGLVVRPGRPGETEVIDTGAPSLREGPVLIQTLEVGICGTDADIIAGRFGQPPIGSERLVLGHEVLGRVIDAPTTTDAPAVDTLVTVAVRKSGNSRCRACEAGDVDMCRDGTFVERGINGLDGFARQRFRADIPDVHTVPESLREVGVLTEPASIAAKAWATADAIRSQHPWLTGSVLVTGAGPIGFLCALLGRQRNLPVQMLDHHAAAKSTIAAGLGASITSDLATIQGDVDLIFECTGDPSVIESCLRAHPNAVTCLLGISTRRGAALSLGELNGLLMHNNGHVFGSVNAGRAHYEAAIAALSAADHQWLKSLISRRVPLTAYRDALSRNPGETKIVLDLATQEDLP